MPPQRLRNNAMSAQKLVQYTLRVFTGSGRGSGLSEPSSGVQVVLIGDNGQASLQYIPRVDVDSTVAFVGSRFDSGNVDDVRLLAPDIGNIASIWIAPESGTWLLEEVAVSGDDAPAVRFPCGRVLGDREPAAALTPSTAVESTPEERQKRTQDGMAEYAALKRSILAFNTGFVVAGGAATTATLGLAYGEVFFTGGVIGLAYMRLLANQVDSMAPTDASPTSLLGPLLTAPARFALVAGMGYLAMQNTVASVLTSEPGVADTVVDNRLLLLLGVTGFFMYKLSVVCASIAAPSTEN